MNVEVQSLAKQLVERAASVGKTGKTVSREEIDALAIRMHGRFPSWLGELLISVPICGLELGWQADEPEDDDDGTEGDDGIELFEISDVKGIRSESLECYPGLAILERGFVNIASCSMGSGDPYFISIDEGEDPPVYQIYHDVGNDAETILAEGRRVVFASLSELFANAKI